MSAILVVDDEVLIRRLIRRMVETPGREIIEACSASEAATLMELRGEGIDLALVDVSLPDINGKDLAGQWLTEFPGLKVVLVSGYPVEPSALIPGRMSFLQKPFTRESLQEALTGAGA